MTVTDSITREGSESSPEVYHAFGAGPRADSPFLMERMFARLIQAAVEDQELQGWAIELWSALCAGQNFEAAACLPATWRSDRARATRDQIILAIRTTWFPTLTDLAAAEMIRRKALRYQATAWSRDKDQVPENWPGPCLERDMCELLKTCDAVPSSRQIRRIIS